jgi:hypothetical protein
MKKKSSIKKIRKILIATPSYDGRVDARYAHNILSTERICAKNNIEIDPVFLCFEAIISKARNDLFCYAYENNYDDIFYIDADISWNPEQFLRIANHPFDFVSGIYLKKQDNIEYPVNIIPDQKIDDNGILEVATVPTGFLRLSRNAIKILWENSLPYTVSQEKKITKLVFETGIVSGRFMSEDIVLCLKWKELKQKIYLDTTVTVAHSGYRTWQGDFSSHIKEFIGKQS